MGVVKVREVEVEKKVEAFLSGCSMSGGSSGVLLLFPSPSLGVAVVLSVVLTPAKEVQLAVAVPCLVCGSLAPLVSLSVLQKGNKTFIKIVLLFISSGVSSVMGQKKLLVGK